MGSADSGWQFTGKCYLFDAEIRNISYVLYTFLGALEDLHTKKKLLYSVGEMILMNELNKNK